MSTSTANLKMSFLGLVKFLLGFLVVSLVGIGGGLVVDGAVLPSSPYPTLVPTALEGVFNGIHGVNFTVSGSSGFPVASSLVVLPLGSVVSGSVSASRKGNVSDFDLRMRMFLLTFWLSTRERERCPLSLYRRVDSTSYFRPLVWESLPMWSLGRASFPLHCSPFRIPASPWVLLSL